MGFVNPFVGPDKEDDDIFKPEIHFTDVFDTFVNSACAKKNLFKLAFRFLVMSKILEISKTHAQKKFNLKQNHKVKIRELWCFGQTAKLKRCKIKRLN